MSWLSEEASKWFDKLEPETGILNEITEIFNDDYREHLFNTTFAGGNPLAGYDMDYDQAEHEGESGKERIGQNAGRSAAILAAIFGGSALASGGDGGSSSSAGSASGGEGGGLFDGMFEMPWEDGFQASDIGTYADWGNNLQGIIGGQSAGETNYASQSVPTTYNSILERLKRIMDQQAIDPYKSIITPTGTRYS